jgi:hypothetical protein
LQNVGMTEEKEKQAGQEKKRKCNIERKKRP